MEENFQTLCEVSKLQTRKSRSENILSIKSALKKFICLPQGVRAMNALSDRDASF